MKNAIRLMAVLAMGAALLMTACGRDENENGSTVEWVDLGLPSGLLWAKCNVGATIPEGYGDHYAWGETEPKEDYSWSTYKYCTVDAGGDLATLTKYNTVSTNGTVDHLTTLQSADDAATAKLGAGARMPTKEEWEELIANTSAEWTTLNGVYGREFTAANGATLFLPAAGYFWGDSLYYEGEFASYWSSSLDSDFPPDAWDFRIAQEAHGTGYSIRCCGYAVRAVRSAR